MAVSVGRRILLDTNVFIDYLQLGSHADWVTGRAHRTIRFLSSVVLLELRLAADTLLRRRAVDRIKRAFPAQRLIAQHPISSTVPGSSSGPCMATDAGSGTDSAS